MNIFLLVCPFEGDGLKYISETLSSEPIRAVLTANGFPGSVKQIFIGLVSLWDQLRALQACCNPQGVWLNLRADREVLVKIYQSNSR